jgi:hypothetical protein
MTLKSDNISEVLYLYMYRSTNWSDICLKN